MCNFEPRWGGVEDVAAPLRGHAALGLVRINYRGVMNLLAELLADPQPAARTAAARALGYSRLPGAWPLLRYKACIGDREPAVTVECLAALASNDPQDSLAFVARFLGASDPATQEGAAFALGESRRAEALGLLLAHWSQSRGGSLQYALLLAIASTRLPQASDFLVETVATGQPDAARQAIAALAIHRHNPQLARRIAEAVAARGDAAIVDEFHKQFPADLMTSNRAGRVHTVHRIRSAQVKLRIAWSGNRIRCTLRVCRGAATTCRPALQRRLNASPNFGRRVRDGVPASVAGATRHLKARIACLG